MAVAKKFCCLVCCLFLLAKNAACQEPIKSDSTAADHQESIEDLIDFLQEMRIMVGKINTDLTFTGTQLINREDTSIHGGYLVIGGYVSTYYAWYNDASVATSEYQKFPTSAPISNTFGLNIAQLSTRFKSEQARATFTLHFGDIPQSAWSAKYNAIQEANVGVKLAKGLWLDAGYFRTHIGLESIQPRENITTSIALITYFEPYFMSGAKLTYEVNPSFHLQLNAFNSFNTFTENNARKAAGLSGVYAPNNALSITLNTLWSDDGVSSDTVKHKNRLYNNLYLTYKTRKITLGFEANLGYQQHSKLTNQAQSATMYSGLIAAKYAVLKNLFVYGRFDAYYDPNEILTGPIYNENHTLIGLETLSYTAGIEFKPMPASYLRFESRYITAAPHESVFEQNNQPSRNRIEIIGALGVWF